MGRQVNANVPEDGFISKQTFLNKGDICDKDLSIVSSLDESTRITFDTSNQVRGSDVVITSGASTGNVILTLPATTSTLASTSQLSNSFATIQPISGTSPTASTSTDTLTLASADGSLAIVGNSSTKTIDFKTKLRTCTVQDVKASGTNGGAGTSNTFVQRVLNTLVDNGTGVTLSSNDMVIPAGTYQIHAMVPGLFGVYHISDLYNSTDSARIALGTVLIGTAGANVTGYSIIDSIFTIAATKHVQIRHKLNTGGDANNFGSAAGGNFSPAENEVYTTVSIIKLN